MNRYVIIVPFHNPWHWHTDYANQTATILSKHHIVFCFLWGDAVSIYELLSGKSSYTPIRKEGNLWKVQPLHLIPGKRIVAVQTVNIIINACAISLFATIWSVINKRETLFWFFGYYDPVFVWLPTIFRRWKTVYDCVDFATSPDTNTAVRIQRSESELLRSAWLVVANSRVLTRHLKNRRSDVHTVPLGFRHEMFIRPIQVQPLPRPHRPVLLYIGSLDYRIDWKLLESLARNHHTFRIMLFGPVFYDHMSPEDIRRMRRVLSLRAVSHGEVSPDEIPRLISAADITIIPYDIRDKMTRHCFPMKLMEYLYGQKPVISTPIEELKRYSKYVRIGKTADDWSQLIKDALRHPLSQNDKRHERRIALRHTWKRKIAQIQSYMDRSQR